MTARPILVVDDEPNMRNALFEALTRQGHAVDLAENGQEAVEKFNSHPFDLVITDVRMPRMDGMDVLKEIKKSSPAVPVVVVSGYGTVETAVEAMREGAYDYIMKPFSLDMIEQTVQRALGLPNTPAPPLKVDPEVGDGTRPIISRNDRMEKLMKMAENVAPSQATVLLQGESGTGKELFARFIHNHSERSAGLFVAVNCASLPEGLLESELFGHEKGSFTGAIAKKIGKFELADGGTILLDEISEMDLSLQAKLLRVLQEGEVDRVGGKAPIGVDVRVIATTNRNLKEWAEQGNFRQDLYYRLNVIPLTIPPLRDRPDDIPLLIEHFLIKHSAGDKHGRKKLSVDAMTRFCQMDWPGNVRELENMIARGVLLSSGAEVSTESIFIEGVPELAPTSSVPDGSALQGRATTIREMERNMIELALGETEGNRTHAAKILGISVRTLRNKLTEYKKMGL